MCATQRVTRAQTIAGFGGDTLAVGSVISACPGHNLPEGSSSFETSPLWWGVLALPTAPHSA